MSDKEKQNTPCGCPPSSLYQYLHNEGLVGEPVSVAEVKMSFVPAGHVFALPFRVPENFRLADLRFRRVDDNPAPCFPEDDK